MNRFLFSVTALFTLSFTASLAQVPPALQDIETDRYRLTLPAPVETSVREEVSTPWGRAKLTKYQTRIGYDVFYIFREYAFPADRKLSVDRLKQVRPFFLRRIKCTAEDVSPPPVWKDAEERPFPQTLFEGVCVSSDSFLVLTALKPPYVYQLQFSKGISNKHTTLQEGLEWLILNVRFLENPPPFHP